MHADVHTLTNVGPTTQFCPVFAVGNAVQPRVFFELHYKKQLPEMTGIITTAFTRNDVKGRRNLAEVCGLMNWGGGGEYKYKKNSQSRFRQINFDVYSLP
jgi:hypothetical protein